MNKLLDAVLGFAVGDALGVPYEFLKRDTFKCTDMIGYGTHNQPAGTWSDDTSLMMATLLALQDDGDYRKNIMDNIVNWYDHAYFTAHKEVFDCGVTTEKAILNYKYEGDVTKCGCTDENSNGNGALMRILPVAFLPFSIDRKLHMTRCISALTHDTWLSIKCCQLYVEIVHNILNGVENWLSFAYSFIQMYSSPQGYSFVQIRNDFEIYFKRIPHLKDLKRNEIKSTGYVIETLEAALWCVLTTDNYKDCVLTAVNLGGDTDTIAALSGALAGLLYGVDSIPKNWLLKLACLPWFISVCERLT